jgi:hypothetical protein
MQFYISYNSAEYALWTWEVKHTMKHPLELLAIALLLLFIFPNLSSSENLNIINDELARQSQWVIYEHDAESGCANYYKDDLIFTLTTGEKIAYNKNVCPEDAVNKNPLRVKKTIYHLFKFDCSKNRTLYFSELMSKWAHGLIIPGLYQIVCGSK